MIKNNRNWRDGFRCWTDAVIYGTYIPLQTYRRLRRPFRSFYNSDILLSSLFRSRTVSAKKTAAVDPSKVVYVYYFSVFDG